MASCILSASKYFQYLKTLALAEGKNASEVSVFIQVSTSIFNLWQQKRTSASRLGASRMTINRHDKSTSISTQLDSLIPTGKISNLTQGMFVGAVSDNFDERIEQKIFHAEIVVDNAAVARETKAYQKNP